MSTPAVESSPNPLRVIEGLEFDGRLNTSEDIILAHVESSIRRQLPQIRPQPAQSTRVVLVGGGPSLAETEDELRQLLYEEPVCLVTLNGAYHWCLERNYRPSAQIVLDARPSNVRFVEPAVPRCRYFLASQCAPEVFDAVADRPEVSIFHAVNDENETAVVQRLHAFYRRRWVGIAGGTTVATRAIAMLRLLGYVRFDLFGIDSCFLDGQHHAYPQPENAKDRAVTVDVSPTDRPESVTRFTCAPWHLKQIEDFLQVMRVSGEDLLLRVHGRGLLAHVINELALSATYTIHEGEQHGGTGLETV